MVLPEATRPSTTVYINIVQPVRLKLKHAWQRNSDLFFYQRRQAAHLAQSNLANAYT